MKSSLTRPSGFKSSSEFIKLTYNADGYYDFFETKNEGLKKVPAAITGSSLPDIFWQIGGSGINGQLATYLKPRAMQLANAELIRQWPESADKDTQEAIGRIGDIDLAPIFQVCGTVLTGKQVQRILYSVSPILPKDGAAAKKEMMDFGEKFRIGLQDKGITELLLPLFSGGKFNGGHDQLDIAAWLMEGWLFAEGKYPKMPGVKVYLCHQNLATALEFGITQCGLIKC